MPMNRPNPPQNQRFRVPNPPQIQRPHQIRGNSQIFNKPPFDPGFVEFGGNNVVQRPRLPPPNEMPPPLAPPINLPPPRRQLNVRPPPQSQDFMRPSFPNANIGQQGPRQYQTNMNPVFTSNQRFQLNQNEQGQRMDFSTPPPTKQEMESNFARSNSYSIDNQQGSLMPMSVMNQRFPPLPQLGHGHVPHAMVQNSPINPDIRLPPPLPHGAFSPGEGPHMPPPGVSMDMQVNKPTIQYKQHTDQVNFELEKNKAESFHSFGRDSGYADADKKWLDRWLKQIGKQHLVKMPRQNVSEKKISVSKIVIPGIFKVYMFKSRKNMTDIEMGWNQVSRGSLHRLSARLHVFV